ncbi:DNA topoisomerase 3-alpha isoform X2 [Coturnix japonica]|uniref:DNA topoisomerase 3-alpha isoform X2 n=1 Tax=Coturnix japonica TaxID=93934 RepID=UPI0013A5DBEC|nr:DNA topoisomerase 3-alpha isoform X2 [Coturnix japonica]
MNLRARLLAGCGVRMLPQPWRSFSRAADGAVLQRIRKVLCVAEKNDAARGIADLLSNSRMRRREGFSKFNKIYEYDYQMFGQNVTVVMTSVSGHLLAHDFKLPFRKWHSCNPLALFDAEIEKYCPENYVDIKRTLEREVQQCQALVIWTDCDREGENIGFEIIHVCKAGAAFTRFQTLRLRKIFPEVLADQLISYGSCQFPTLGFVVERFKAIQAFVPEAFYKIKVTHDHEDGNVVFNWKRNRLFNHTACLVLYHMCMEDPVATVVEVGSKPKSKWRPLPLDTVELEKLASRKLKINAKETMRIAEKLYTQGFISYPRTETNIFPKELNLSALIQQQTQDPNWGAFAQRILDQGGPNPRNGTKSDQAHPPIHPTKYTANLQGNEQRLYEFIVRHFLACCSQDAKGQETTVEIDIANERFIAQGLMILARNYLEVYPYEKWSDKVIPLYQKGSRFQPTTVEMVDGETSPPLLLTEADLIALMEKHGIGTDATHAEHIETIKTRMYVGLTADQRFLPGHLGMGLVEGYDSMGYEMSKPDLRAELEADLKLICEGKKDKSIVLQQQVQKYKQVFIEAVAKANKLDQALAQYFGEATEIAEQEEVYPAMPVSIRKCPQCNNDMVLKTRKNGGFYLSCMGYPACKTAVWFPDFVLDVAKDESVCPVCTPHPVHRLKFKFKRGSVPPTMPLEFVGCIGGCDQMLKELLDLRYSNRSSQSGQSASQQANHLQVNNSLNRANSENRHVGGRTNVATGHLLYLNSTRAPRPAPSAAPDDGNNAVVCNCGNEATLLTVRKEGPNQGRQFYKCSANTCNFFLWSDQQSEDRSNVAPRGSLPLQAFGARGPVNSQRPGGKRGPEHFGSSNNSSSGGSTVCRCDQPAVTRTVQKDGPNKGRQFHTCSKPREQQCGFFQWADENVTPGASGDFSFNHFGNGGYSRELGSKAKRPSNPSHGATAKKPRTCSICHQPGHTKKTCPQDH